jgi:hypothetical protein
LLSKNPRTKSTVHGPRAPSVHHGPVPWLTSGAHRSSASSHSGSQGHRGRGRGGGGGGGGGEHICGLIRAWEVVNSGTAERDGRRWSVLGEVGVADSGASKGGRG